MVTYVDDEMMKQIDGKAELYLAQVNEQHFDYTCKDIDYGIAYIIKEAYRKGCIDALRDNR